VCHFTNSGKLLIFMQLKGIVSIVNLMQIHLSIHIS
jgi:hypothetical protein